MLETLTPAQRLAAAARKAQAGSLVLYAKKHLFNNPAMTAFVRAPVNDPRQALTLLDESE